MALKPDQELPDEAQAMLATLSNSKFFDLDQETLQSNPIVQKLKKRKLCDIKTLTYYIVQKGEQYQNTFLELKADLTYEDVRNNLHKDLSLFKEMNLQSKGKPILSGGLHPLMKMRTEFRNILLEMGFEEMDTKQYVETSLFNFDALFQPQQHPARDAHDTFFLAEPKTCSIENGDLKEYVQKVKEMHQSGYQDGSVKSFGWNYQWSIDEAQKNILRTHTTAVSARYLYQIG